MAVAVVTCVFVITSLGVSLTSACVNFDPSCRPPTATLAPWVFNAGITNPLTISTLVSAGLASALTVVMLVWAACWCCHRCNAGKTPKAVKPQKQKFGPVDSFKSVAPVVLQRPTEIVVVEPPPSKPTALLLNITDPSRSNRSGPTLSARVARPLTFTITPDYGMNQ